MKLNSLICIHNNYSTPLIEGYEEIPDLAVFDIASLADFKKSFTDYGINYLMFLIDGNNDKLTDDIKLVLLSNKNIIPIIILPFDFEEGVNIQKAQEFSRIIQNFCPLSILFNFSSSKQLYKNLTFAEFFKEMNKLLLDVLT